ncbi:MAG: response regulator transcription factor [Bacteroidales bacterium]|nr:response regulator transcription factor [Bacteroidales bacterium]
MKKYSVFLVDDHKLFREGLKLLLTNLTFIDHIYEASNGKEFLNLLDTHIPDIVFIDIDMPELNGIEATKAAIQKIPELKIIALSMYGEYDYYTKMINAGAKGFLLKNSDIQEVEAAITNVLDGKNYFSHEIMHGLFKNINKKTEGEKLTKLTGREKEILYNICKGLSNNEIAGKLFLSKRTVDKHRENILTKTGSKNTASLVIYAIKNGIIEI